MKPSPYAGYDPLSEADYWEDRDRELVMSRLRDVPALRFFSPGEASCLQAVVDRLIPQPDRSPRERVPVVPFLDQMLFDDDTDGFRRAGMPWDQQMWRLALAGIDQASAARHGAAFAAIPPPAQDDVLAAVQSGRAEGQAWHEMAAAEAFGKIMQQVVSVYYAHPAAWAEIGWPGPASRRGYMRTGYGRLDPWQPPEQGELSSVHLVDNARGGSSAAGSAGATH